MTNYEFKMHDIDWKALNNPNSLNSKVYFYVRHPPMVLVMCSKNPPETHTHSRTPKRARIGSLRGAIDSHCWGLSNGAFREAIRHRLGGAGMSAGFWGIFWAHHYPQHTSHTALWAENIPVHTYGQHVYNVRTSGFLSWSKAGFSVIIRLRQLRKHCMAWSDVGPANQMWGLLIVLIWWGGPWVPLGLWWHKHDIIFPNMELHQNIST